MEDNNKKIVDILNNLVEINNDRMEGYFKAKDETKEPDLKQLFTDLAADSKKCKEELVAEVKKLGGTPVEGTRNTGKLYRAWMDIKSALTGRDKKAIVSSCEFGEDVAKKNYEDTLESKDLTPELHELVNKQYAVIKGGHDKVKTLRDSLVKVNA